MKNKIEYPTIIVTSGGTSVPIDNVRKITNKSSGKLGALITNYIFKAFKNKVNVIYIHSHKAILPKKNKRLQLIEADEYFDVKKVLKNELTTKNIAAVVHSMAISDYVLDYTTSSTKFFNFMKTKRKFDPQRFIEFIWDISETEHTIKDTKISGDNKDLIVHLIKAPKLIDEIKELSPNTTLIGFKLLSNPALYQISESVNKLFTNAKCDYVLYNDLIQINEKYHPARLFKKGSDIEIIGTNYGTDISSNAMSIFETKKEIAKGLAKVLVNEVNNKRETQ